MPLLDHFRPPVSTRVTWKPFHAGWAYELARRLNRKIMSLGYLAVQQTNVGSQLQVDVGTWEGRREPLAANGPGGGTATAVEPWAPPAAAMVMPAVFPDEIEVRVFETEGGLTLVGAVELVSPRNKDRPDARRGFAAKVASYLQAGIGVVVIDIVTVRQQNLHDELVRLLDYPEEFVYPTAAPLYAVSYRPGGDETAARVEVWPFDLSLGQELPTVPLPLRDGPTVPLELNDPYEETRASLGL